MTPEQAKAMQPGVVLANAVRDEVQRLLALAQIVSVGGHPHIATAIIVHVERLQDAIETATTAMEHIVDGAR